MSSKWRITSLDMLFYSFSTVYRAPSNSQLCGQKMLITLLRTATIVEEGQEE